MPSPANAAVTFTPTIDLVAKRYQRRRVLGGHNAGDAGYLERIAFWIGFVFQDIERLGDSVLCRTLRPAGCRLLARNVDHLYRPLSS
jgi:hypothetical protein